MQTVLELIRLLVPVVVSSLCAFLISRHVTRKQLAPVILPKLMEFRSAVEEALRFPSDEQGKVLRKEVSSEEAADMLQKLTLRCIDTIEKYKMIRPYLKNKHRRRIDLAVSMFEEEHKKISSLFLKLGTTWTPERLEREGMNPLDELGRIGKIAFGTLETMRKEISANIDKV